MSVISEANIRTSVRLELRIMAVQEQEQLGFAQKRQVIHLTKMEGICGYR